MAGPAQAAAPRCRDIGRASSPRVAGLEAQLTVLECAGPDGTPELLLNGRIWNTSLQPVRLFTMPLSYAMLTFDLRKATGEPIPGGPPPVPPVDAPRFHLELAPDADYLFDAALRDVVAVDLPPGPYEIRLDYEHTSGASGDWTGHLVTAWVRFSVP